ncbi:HK97 gp10 family phage protein [Pseudochrobactrum saccharolyticum]|uniref:HK97 gp10 family phage protein n=1 Tax=Pseudochrobactrum saccharolyticum TaxID=354352 RepID=A0A7W8ENR2_9HYPH|nr:HK97-gp10 family putative phage morphogenesis protein [Pseudochrobactrum saccharolyticum]KAB0538470.1 HK97 gp10 family phage protein [Pseudochrobactrum saccharolyticum]MBB5091755.1 HK97 gp10 family phage protein [Pseudochrobactrum saccharolyticum]
MATASRIIGLVKLQRKIGRLSKVAKQEIKQALEQSAEEIVSLAKSLVPVDQGALRDSIGWTWGKVPKGAMTIGKVAEASLAGELTITIYAGNSDAFYARWVEFGTQKMGAQPYFYPSYRANKKSTRNRIRSSVRQAAKQVASS